MKTEQAAATVLPIDAVQALMKGARKAMQLPEGSRNRSRVVDEAIAYVYIKYPEYFRKEAIEEFKNRWKLQFLR